jgi:hypothetical protein
LTASQLIKAIALAPAEGKNGSGLYARMAAHEASAKRPAPGGAERAKPGSTESVVQAVLAARAKAEGVKPEARA